MNNEIWKTIEGRQRYEISNLGNVRSKPIEIEREGKNGFFGKWKYGGKILNPTTTEGGYKTIMLVPTPGSEEKNGQRLVHRLVWEAFGDRPRKGNEDIDHINGIKTDNRIDNLRLLTRSENMIAYHKRVGTRGTVKQTPRGNYEARFNLNKKSINCGFYSTEKDARTALKAFLNFIDNKNL